MSIASAKVTVTNVQFNGMVTPHEVIITANGPIQAEKIENTEDSQIIIELKEASLARKGIARRLDTSSFKSQVSLISPYAVEGKDSVRVVVQLRKMVSTDLKIEGSTAKLLVPFEVDVGAGQSQNSQSNQNAVKSPQEPQNIESALNSSNKATDKTVMSASAPKSRMEEFADARETRKYIGKPISLQVRDADLVDVFRLIGEASGFNILISEDVRGKITLSLVDVPWDMALDTVLHTNRLGAERTGNILRIASLSSLTAEKQEILAAKKAAQASAPRVTKIFPISYAKLADLQNLLTKFGNNEAGGTGSQTANIAADDRTNSIVVQDISENIERMKKLVELMDTQTPQVMIESKVVEATESFSRSIGGSMGFGGRPTQRVMGAVGFGGANPVDPLFGDPGIFKDGSAFATAAKGGSQFAQSFDLGFIKGMGSLNALLSLGETENEVKVVAAPKVVVLNKESANLVQGTPVLTKAQQNTPNGIMVVDQVQQANLSLKVTPTVTNEGSVLLELSISRDIPFQLSAENNAVANRNIQTKVVVESGTTLVIGGIYTMDKTSAASGFPWLRKIPIIGAFFGSESKSTRRSELFIFVTPRIINEKEAGLSG